MAVLLFTFVNVQVKLSQVKADLDTQLAGNPFRGFADVALQSFQLEWGWGLLVVGAVCLVAVGMTEPDIETSHGDVADDV